MFDPYFSDFAQWDFITRHLFLKLILRLNESLDAGKVYKPGRNKINFVNSRRACSQSEREYNRIHYFINNHVSAIISLVKYDFSL